MKVDDPGHSYSLNNLKEKNTCTVLRFFKDKEINGEGHSGPPHKKC